MSTDPSAHPGSSAAEARKHNLRLGLSLFVLYTTLYAGFVLTNAFYPAAMEVRPWGGLNVALLSGFSLIAVAILLAFIYGICSHAAAKEARS